MSHPGRRLSALVDGELDGTRRERVLAHLARCEPCRAEVVALRSLKQRMRALGEATADEALHERLVELARRSGQSPRQFRAVAGRRHRPGQAVRRRPVRVLVAVAVLVPAAGLPTAAFLLGGSRPPPGPKVTPAVEVFMVQHAITTGDTPVQPGPAVSHSTRPTP